MIKKCLIRLQGVAWNISRTGRTGAGLCLLLGLSWVQGPVSAAPTEQSSCSLGQRISPDLDGDYGPDAIQITQIESGYQVEIRLSSRNGTVSIPLNDRRINRHQVQQFYLCAYDVDRDHDQDLVLFNAGSQTLFLLRNEGEGRFTAFEDAVPPASLSKNDSPAYRKSDKHTETALVTGKPGTACCDRQADWTGLEFLEAPADDRRTAFETPVFGRSARSPPLSSFPPYSLFY